MVIANLLHGYPHHPVSFFAELRACLTRAGAAPAIQRLTAHIGLISGQADRYRGHVEAALRTGLDPLFVEQTAAALHEQHQAANNAYLRPAYLAPSANRGE